MTAPSVFRLYEVLASAGRDLAARLTSGHTRNQPARGRGSDGRYPPDEWGPDAGQIAATKAAPAEGHC